MSLKYENIIKQMTLAEKAQMMSGKNTWETVDFEKYGIPSMFMSDGPHGLRRQAGAGDHLGLNASLPATCFPTAAGVANSWDEELGEKIGEALAEEAVTMGVNVILGPGLNIKRSPLCGRNFEYFSEDPYHAGKMAAAYIRGIQSKGIAACPKHFAANSQELRRMANDSVVDERTFREIYTTGFEIAVKEGKAKSIMSAYNEVNGVYANENKHILQEILVDEWGFDGFVVSDWGGSNDHALGVKNGSHLEMPGTGKAGMNDIIRAVKNGDLDEEVLDQRLDELLNVIFATHQATEEGKGKQFDVEAHHTLARKAAEESIVLLKNEDKILPLKPGTKVAVIGDFAKTPRYQGAGSSLVNSTKKPEAILDVIGKSGLEVTAYAQGYIRNKKPNEKLMKAAVEAARNADVVLFFGGLDEISESEGLDRTNMHMPLAQNTLLNELTTVNSNVIVVLSAGSAIEMPWTPYVKGIVHGYLGGQAGASAMMNVLTGKVNPSGKLNETYPMHYRDTPAYAYYPSKERSSEYRESLYVGYRFYETAAAEGAIDYDKEVVYPFGYGLSYTTFDEKMGDLKEADGKISVDVTITNTGDVAGKQVAELYYNPPYTNGGIEKASTNLIAFDKTDLLEPGESQTLTLSFNVEDMASYDYQNEKAYVLEAGNYEISLQTDSHTIVDTDTYTVDDEIVYNSDNKRSTDEVAATNAFDFAEGDITYLSRADQFANMEEAFAAPTNYSISDEAKAEFTNNSNWKAEEDKDAVMPTTDAKNNLELADMRGLDYDDNKWDDLLDELSVSDMVDLVALGGYQTAAANSVGKVNTTDCDGPASINNNFTGVGSIGFPCGVMIANSFNEDIAKAFGDSIGEMADEMNVSGWYAPAMNIHRNAFAGRNFEYYSEDGLLSGKIAAQAVQGAAEHGVYAYIKHFAMNSQETGRWLTSMDWANEQAIREIYLKPFEIAVKEGNAKAVMSSYNYIGTQWAGACNSLLNTVLRDEWGFEGFVLTDYFAGFGYMDAERSIYNGGDACLSNYDAGTNYIKNTDSATTVTNMRRAAHDILYTVVNSRAYDEKNLNTGLLLWQIILIVVDVLVAVLIILLEIIAIKKFRTRSQADKAARKLESEKEAAE